MYYYILDRDNTITNSIVLEDGADLSAFGAIADERVFNIGDTWTPVPPTPEELEAALAEAKAARIQQSKDDLEAYLEAHPITWTDGNQYSITREKQQQLTSKILSATLAHQTSTPYELTWNATGAECTPWTLEQLAALAFAIDGRVTALVSYQQAKEVAMQAAATLEELEGVKVDYDEVS